PCQRNQRLVLVKVVMVLLGLAGLRILLAVLGRTAGQHLVERLGLGLELAQVRLVDEHLACALVDAFEPRVAAPRARRLLLGAVRAPAAAVEASAAVVSGVGHRSRCSMHEGDHATGRDVTWYGCDMVSAVAPVGGSMARCRRRTRRRRAQSIAGSGGSSMSDARQ